MCFWKDETTNFRIDRLTMEGELTNDQNSISEASSSTNVVLNGSIFNICSLSTETAKNELDVEKFDAVSTASLTQNLIDANVLVDTSKGLIFSVAEDVSDLGLSSVNHGVEVATSTVPSQLLQHDPVTTSETETITTPNFIQIVNADVGTVLNAADMGAGLNADVINTNAVISPEAVLNAEAGEIAEIVKDDNSKTGEVAEEVATLVTGTDGSTFNTILSIIPASSLPVVGAQAVLKPMVAVSAAGQSLKRKGGWPKGKRRKEQKASPIPKPPATGYVLYATENRRRVRQENPSATFADITKILGSEWSNLEVEQKQKYLQLAEDDKTRYKEELKAYKESEQFQSYLAKKSTVITSTGQVSGGDLDGSEVDVDSDILYCKVCDQYFSSIHNRKEHMFGKTHLNKVSSAIEKITKAAESPPPPPPAPPPAIEDTPPHPSPPSPHNSSQPLDMEAFIISFMDRNTERESELHHLRRSVENLQSQNLDLVNNIKELTEMHNKYIQDLGNAKAYGAALATQIDTLRMVPTLFGVINF